MKVSKTYYFKTLALIGLLCLLGLFKTVQAETKVQTLWCQPEVGAGLEHSGSSEIEANLYNASELKLRLTNETGTWQLWENHDQEPIFANCQSKYRCEPIGWFYGVFYMTKDNVFTYIIQKAYGSDLSREIVYSFKGHCQPSA